MRNFLKVESGVTTPKGIVNMRKTFIDLDEIKAIREETFSDNKHYYNVYVGVQFFPVSKEDAKKIFERLGIEE